VTDFFQHSVGLPYGWAWTVATLAGILLIALPVMLAVAMIIYADRKIWAAMALRRGPNVVGPFGLMQSFADGLKVFLQETIIPSAANKGLFLIAPIITFTVALIVWAVVPFAPGVLVSNINVGLLYVLAASSLGVYGIILAGWASNSKYPFYSAIRAAAQMVSYEVAIGFVLICMVMWAGSFNLSEIVEAQRNTLGIHINAFGINPLLFPMSVMFLISGMAETGRAPFDLTEAESELVAGYQTEYSSMSFALYWLGEYANVILMCVLNATLFWGGYLPPIDWAPLYAVPGILWLFAKMLFFFFVFSWVKATVPRYRYDQLMRLGWKVFLPVSLFWVFLVSGVLMFYRVGIDCPPSERVAASGYATSQGTVRAVPLRYPTDGVCRGAVAATAGGKASRS
jgi:NADH-quinone oxidoreductase subunit H